MPSIFHYTDTAGALGILSSQTLFASDSRYLNDSTEGALVDSLLAPILQNEIAATTRELIEANLLSKKYYEELGSNADKLQVDALFRSIKTATNNVSPCFVVSFCRHQEGSEHFSNGLLSQWRGYADRGGFALEFDEDGLAACLKKEVERYFFGPVVTRDVLYEEFEKIFNPKDYEGLARAMVGKLFLDPKVTSVFDYKKRRKLKEITGDKNIDEAISSYLSISPFLKNYGFHEEREYRIAVACVQRKKIPKEAKEPAKPVEFRTRGNLIVPYIRLFDGSKTELPVKAIIVGPHPYQELQKEAILRLLEDKGVDASVRLSGIPFRGQ
jgi:hypothetical protein